MVRVTVQPVNDVSKVDNNSAGADDLHLSYRYLKPFT
jgi:hypothetical protein